MKKISLFMLMIFGIFMLFAADAAPETAQENAAAPETAQTPAEPAAEQAQPAETAQEPAAEPAQEPAGNAPEPAETAPEPVETSPETSQEPAENTMEPVSEVVEEPVKKAPRAGKPQKIRYYRPYLGAGIPLIVIGSVSFAIMMPAMGTMAFAASDACEGKDWGFCEQLHDNNKKHHTAWTVGAVMTGVVGAGMIAVGSWLTSIQKPREDQCVTLEGVAVLPTKDGMYASIGLGF